MTSAGGSDSFFLFTTRAIRFDNLFSPHQRKICIHVAGGFYVRLILARIIVRGSHVRCVRLKPTL
mgnify:CR=1 FL=1